ncbi:hypothetical protein Vadar_011834 [Vaccinium darrowii]|uniref:Uncharacterized protein n=1 Tax=Vaccinium darrowii TaxID=229202 RepID=A0ACB7XQ03_9ERIC|nr:hypothetical protein Vadar_011834 [Vaccinium darrowii]
MSRRRAATGWRSCIEASKEGWGCEGNLVDEFGSGGGGEEIGGVEFVEVDLGIFEAGLGNETEFGLAEMGGGGGVVDGDVVGGRDEAGEVEELVEMAMAWEWHYYYFH